jgi:hypothetical protein
MKKINQIRITMPFYLFMIGLINILFLYFNYAVLGNSFGNPLHLFFVFLFFLFLSLNCVSSMSRKTSEIVGVAEAESWVGPRLSIPFG